jgi:twitching motility two-component system response regulator PilH
MNVVLVVDDNAAVRMVLSDFLAVKFPNLRILQAVDGVEGVALAKAENPDLILLDAEMPYMNGYEAAQKIRAGGETKHIPIIAISSGIQSNQVVAGLRSISNASLPKPFTADELIDVVSQVLEPIELVV